ncbi:P-loop containing nucleoside triphosphate hydrolase protein [Aureobasidium subglaciale]|nr:P-loop containing nucleoside triphosphate hydrolase protein [Aureobasidium subglaciale]KAI5224177.1 P-loop containing nucleoside triphosphate hydrolase protein [Aureobasidium subglaciale]KAI5228273.1 P-loop containing nucleoside triphosphate hydrolase protein [Aureobasidium subglaciale]KAI5262850.1 P-loop containing nucleoside triphosphate hydrolase protein [Aureobasidium subglaciale]
MVNKPHAPRSSTKSSKKTASTAATANGEDTSYIVFSNGKDSKKSKKNDLTPPAAASSAAPAKGKGKNAAPELDVAGDPVKKPDTRTLIGGQSWTGKLPVNMLSEHCLNTLCIARQIASVILRWKNPKTQEMVRLPPMSLPPAKRSLGVQETAVEARHFAATYALYRVANAKNLHMMMPPDYRDLWKGEFAEMRKEATKEGMGWLYAADPFQARKEWDDERAAKEKKRLEREKQMEAEKKDNSTPGVNKNPGKGWTRAPKVEMGKKMRRDVEALVRQAAPWNPHGVTLSNAEKKHIVQDLSKLGFRPAHVEEATEICKDREETIEWLLIHVPEDDLPKWSLPENYSAGVSMASSDLAREGKLKRLAITGYAMELCEEALDEASGDEAKAAGGLQHRLLGSRDSSALASTTDSLNLSHDIEVWEEEQVILASIYSDRYKSTKTSCQIVLEVADKPKERIVLHARKPSAGYPNVVPVLSIEAALPAYIRLSILKQVLLQAQSDFLGEQMLFNLVDWLEHEIPNIIANPGRLSSIASVSSTSAEPDAEIASRRRQRPRRMPRPINWQPSSQQSQRMLSDWQARQNTPAQQRMMVTRQGLPAWKLRNTIVEAVTSSQVTIISGETGSGKSTQSVQFVLDDMIRQGLGEAANIICTQPRRISALGLADRVADERCVKVGEEVGYSIRGESKQKPGTTKITFVTTGVLLRRLQTSGGKQQDVVDALADVSHVVIDEVHERSLDTDFLMVLLRDVLQVRKDLKLILMSATLDAEIFKSYFAGNMSVSTVEIQGRTHPVQDIYLDDILRMTGFAGGITEEGDEDGGKEPTMGAALRSVGMKINYDLISDTVQTIDEQLGSQDGGILIFLPGVAEIDRTLKTLQHLHHIHALPLHASLQPAEQKRVFPPAPAGKRKVICATNVAETSITIEDIVAVIDSGRVKETSFDAANGMTKLEEVWASRAACKQRRGRAGRVRAGTCYKLYTKQAESTKMAERPDPEILRVPLEQLCLSVKAMGVLDVPSFLARAITPPSTLAVSGALTTLHRMGALDGAELTALGRHLSSIPANLRCGKLLIYGAVFGCLDACLTIASILTARSPFVSPPARRDEAKTARLTFAPGGQGDLLCDLRAFELWTQKRAEGIPSSSLRQWCDVNFLSTQTLFDIQTNRRQYMSSLQEIGFLNNATSASSSTDHNARNNNTALIRALVAAAFSPQVARIEFPDTKYAASVSGAIALDPEAKTIKYFREPNAIAAPCLPGKSTPSQPEQGNSRLFIHPSSTLFSSAPGTNFPPSTAFLAYFSLLSTSKTFIRDLTPFNAYTLLLFSGDIALDTQNRGLVVDGWIRLKGWARIGVLVGRLRSMLDAVLEGLVERPGEQLGGREKGLVDLVARLVELDGLDR